MTEPTPADTLRAAIRLLESSAQVAERAPDLFEASITGRRDLNRARAILATAPAEPLHGPQDVGEPVPGADAETADSANGAQTGAQRLGDVQGRCPEPDAASTLLERRPDALDGRLRERLHAALEAARREWMRPLSEAGQQPLIEHLADVATAVRDRHQEQLAAGRATWKAKAEEIEADRDRLATEVDRLTGLLAEYADRGIANGQRADRAEAAVRRVRQMAQAWQQQLPATIRRDTATGAVLTATEQFAHLDTPTP